MKCGTINFFPFFSVQLFSFFRSFVLYFRKRIVVFCWPTRNVGGMLNSWKLNYIKDCAANFKSISKAHLHNDESDDL